MAFKKDFKTRKNVATEAYEENKFVAPEKEQVSRGSEMLQAKAYRDLSNIKVIDVKADPNTELSYGSFPYVIIGQTCPVVDAKYDGEGNIAGNSIVQIQNNTTSSLLMNTYDVAVQVKKLNYLYAPIEPTGSDETVSGYTVKSGGINTAIAGEMIKAIEQAVSFGFSTMLTQLAFTTGSYTSEDASHNVHLPVPTEYEGKNAVGWYRVLMHYQCVLQSLVNPINKYIELRSLEKEMMRMSFRTEAPIITQIFGLFKKSSFVSTINTIGSVVINEYFDNNWYTQMNTLLCVPSRKTRGMQDPLLTMIGIHKIPYMKATWGDVVYDYADLKTSATYYYLDPEDYTSKQAALSLEDLVMNVCKLMNPAYILRFARLINNGTLPSGAITSVSAYVEAAKHYIEQISIFAAMFSTKMSDVRTFLDKLSQSGMVYWQKGRSFFVDKIVQLEPHYNALLNDVFAASHAGANVMQYDASTKRWRAWAFWNKYTGIPEYDRVAGGSFLTFGLRRVAKTDTASATVDFGSSSGLVPILFTTFDHNIIVNRLGGSSSISHVDLDNTNTVKNPYLSRLNPLKATNLTVKIPQVETTVADETKRAHQTSALLQFFGNVFGFGRVKYSTSYSTTIDPDYVCFIDLEIEDVSNRMIIFCRNYSPFRVDTPDGARTIGFAK